METAEANFVIVGGGIFGLSLAFELARLGHTGIEVLEQKHLGYGATSRNIGRVRTSQFTLPLARFAKAAFAKHKRLGDQLGANTLFWTPGYALVFYDDEEMEHIDGIRAMLRDLGQSTEFKRGVAVIDRLPILRGGEPPVGCLIRPDASVHHDALLHAYRRALKDLKRRVGVDMQVGPLVLDRLEQLHIEVTSETRVYATLHTYLSGVTSHRFMAPVDNFPNAEKLGLVSRATLIAQSLLQALHLLLKRSHTVFYGFRTRA